MGTGRGQGTDQVIHRVPPVADVQLQHRVRVTRHGVDREHERFVATLASVIIAIRDRGPDAVPVALRIGDGRPDYFDVGVELTSSS